MDRFYIAPGNWEASRLDGEEAHHCLRVMRKAEGDEVEVFDGVGRWARGVISGAEGESVTLTKTAQGRSGMPAPEVTLCVAIPKGKTMDLVIQKAVELGVARIQPLITERTVARPDDVQKKQSKWQRVALEACKQCGQNVLPKVETALPIGSWLPMRFSSAKGIVAVLDPAAPLLRTHLRESVARTDSIEIVIGPEGDLSDAETAALCGEGFAPVSFGTIVLRVETAAIFALGAVRYEFGGRQAERG